MKLYLFETFFFLATKHFNTSTNGRGVLVVSGKKIIEVIQDFRVNKLNIFPRAPLACILSFHTRKKENTPTPYIREREYYSSWAGLGITWSSDLLLCALNRPDSTTHAHGRSPFAGRRRRHILIFSSVAGDDAYTEREGRRRSAWHRRWILEQRRPAKQRSDRGGGGARSPPRPPRQW